MYEPGTQYQKPSPTPCFSKEIIQSMCFIVASFIAHHSHHSHYTCPGTSPRDLLQEHKDPISRNSLDVRRIVPIACTVGQCPTGLCPPTLRVRRPRRSHSHPE